MKATLPSMPLPIQHAISYPVRLNTVGTGLMRELRWPDVARLDFESLDIARFPCFRLAMEAAKRGGTYPCVLVGADEEAGSPFLQGKIRVFQIAGLIETMLGRQQPITPPGISPNPETCALGRKTGTELN